jgi:hypothetical protein
MDTEIQIGPTGKKLLPLTPVTHPTALPAALNSNETPPQRVPA